MCPSQKTLATNFANLAPVRGPRTEGRLNIGIALSYLHFFHDAFPKAVSVKNQNGPLKFREGRFIVREFWTDFLEWPDLYAFPPLQKFLHFGQENHWR